VVPPIRLIALDLDGTLLDPSDAISPANRAAVAAARAAGVRVIFVTGRGAHDPLRFARELGLTDPLICAHGAITLDVPTGRELRHIAIHPQYAEPIIRFAQREYLDCAVYVDGRFHRHTGRPRYMEDMVGPTWVDVESLDHLARMTPTFIRFFGRESVAKVRAEFADFPVHFKLESWMDFEELAITSLDATKERALTELCADLGVASQEVLAIGDSRNDIPMLLWSGIGVAMGNALNEVLERAPYVTASNTQDGVARAIERFVLNPPERKERSA
jgi:5-amino-6-(5-phospho-D-ribitylamino)uracil phosphatase